MCRNIKRGHSHRNKQANEKNEEHHLLKMSLSSCGAQGCEAIFISSVDSGFCIQQQSHTVYGFLTESHVNTLFSAMMGQAP